MKKKLTLLNGHDLLDYLKANTPLTPEEERQQREQAIKDFEELSNEIDKEIEEKKNAKKRTRKTNKKNLL